MATIREQVKDIVSKSFEEYNLNDIRTISNLKSQLGQKVAKAEADYLYAEQTTKQEVAKYMILCKADGMTIEESKQQALVHTKDYKEAEIKAYISYKQLKLFYDDLGDQVTAMRMCNRIYNENVNNG